MNAEAIQTAELAPLRTSVMAKMLNMFVSPAQVFEEVVSSPANITNWLVPTVLVCLSSLFVLGLTTAPEQTTGLVQQMLEAGRVTQAQAESMTAHWPAVSRLASCLVVFMGTFWSALAIWLMGKFVLRSGFSYVKALEVVGLSTTILILSGVVTGLLVLATGDPGARPGLSIFCSGLSPENPLHAIGEVLNVFHIWAAAVMAIGLARLSRLSIKEAAFWVFGFWIFGRMAVTVLA